MFVHTGEKNVLFGHDILRIVEQGVTVAEIGPNKRSDEGERRKCRRQVERSKEYKKITVEHR